MWSRFSDAAEAALLEGHFVESKVEVWHSGRVAAVLEPVDGGVEADADRPIRRNLTCSLVDPTGALSKGDVEDLLDPYECEVAAYRGVQIGGMAEYAPHGVFRLTRREVNDAGEGLAISLVGQDRTMGYQGPMDSSLAIRSGTPIEDAIALLLAKRNQGVQLDALRTGFTCGSLLYPPDIDVWREASDLATSVGASLFHDRTGQCVLSLAGPASDTPTDVFVEGDGRLLTVSRSEDSDTICNVVVAESVDGRIRAVAEDTDPTSPTYARGRYGRHPAKPLVSQHIHSVDQAMQAATARLAYELGRSETVAFTAVPHPAMDVQEVVTVHRPRAGLDHRALLVATLNMPLKVAEGTTGKPMQIGCRKSVLAQDGRVLPPAQVTA